MGFQFVTFIGYNLNDLCRRHVLCFRYISYSKYTHILATVMICLQNLTSLAPLFH